MRAPTLDSAREGSRLIDNDRDSWIASVSAMPDAALAEANRLWTIVRAYSNTAHAVNNALQVIGGRAELLEAHYDAGSDSLTRVKAIRAQAAKAGSAIETLLSYSRADQVQQATDLRMMLDATVGMRSHTLNRSGVAVAVEASVADVRVTVPRRPLQQLLINLVMLVESRVAHRGRARIVVTLDMAGDDARIGISGAVDQDRDSSVPGVVDEFGAEACLRVVRFLSGQLALPLHAEMPEAGVPQFTLTIPAASLRTAAQATAASPPLNR